MQTDPIAAPLTIEIHNPEVAALLREKMRDDRFNVEAILQAMLDWQEAISAEPLPEPKEAVNLLKGATPNDDLYLAQARLLDLAVAIKKSDFETKKFIVIYMLLMLSDVNGPYQGASRLAARLYGIHIEPNRFEEYWRLMRSANPDAEMNTFLKRVSEQPDLKNKLMKGSKNYAEIARVAEREGLKKTAAEWEKYLKSWEFLTQVMKGLVERGAMNQTQFKDRTGFQYGDLNMAHLGEGIDLMIMGGVLSATGWSSKISGLGNLKVPMAAIIFPTTIVMMEGMEGRKFEFKELGQMFAQSFVLALEGMVIALDEMRAQFDNFFH
jgi:hypothetical protein